MLPPRDDPPRDLFPTDEEIAELAFERCFSLLDAGDDALGYLDAAENELLDRAAKRALLTIKPRRPR
jgi:hypothetical protein